MRMLALRVGILATVRKGSFTYGTYSRAYPTCSFPTIRKNLWLNSKPVLLRFPAMK